MSLPVALFRVAAGTRLGHGHLRRAEALASQLPLRPLVSLRGSGAPTTLHVTPRQSAANTLDAVAPRVLVIDDPHAGHARRWCLAATQRGIPVVSLHDLGLARVPSTLAVDGSIVSPSRGWDARAVLRGPAYAVIRPAPRRRGAVRASAARVLLSLGGGPRFGVAMRLARELRRRHPAIEVIVPSPDRRALIESTAAEGVRLLTATSGLGAVLPTVDLALLGGGMSLYEAAAAGVPAVALAVVPAQRPTIRGLAKAGTLRDAGRLDVRRSTRWVGHVVDVVSEALLDATWRREAARCGPRVVDGRGAGRVARATVRLLERNARG